MPTKQAAASVGQCELMYTYDKLFTEYNHTVGQILITGEDVEHPERSVNLKNTLSRLLELGALPIVNENDTVSTTEIALGDQRHAGRHSGPQREGGSAGAAQRHRRPVHRRPP